METILVVDDEEDIQVLLSYNLEKAGYNVITASTGEEALNKAINSLPAVILLDILLPGLSGFETLKRLRSEKKTAETPIVMVSAKGEEEDVVKGLTLGADDYITKPFSVNVLVARVEAALRRRRSPLTGEKIEVEGITLDKERHEAFIFGEKMDLTFSEFAIMELLLKRRGGVLTRQQIVSEIRGGEITVTDRSVDVHMTSIRKKLKSLGPRILTVRGVGYRFDM
ncbi:MAG: response regulator transcription factor [Nitrospinae bacterium]|nr:response regulator transcription factor [Nitrospinota bacterium]